MGDEILSQRDVWDDWARTDPLWAILAFEGKERGRWDPEEFFANGRREIASLMKELAELGLDVETGRCLDFGCGVGRLSQALAGVFDRVDGVDISETMVERARAFNQHGDRCHYHVNVAEDLGSFGDAEFDFVYSNIVLQHNLPEVARGYMTEFVRILKPGGLTVFDMPDSATRRLLAEGAHRAQLELLSPMPDWRVGAKQTVRVRVTNASEHDWPPGSLVRLGNHWRGPRGRMIVRNDGRVTVPSGLATGASADMTLEATAPARPGRYRLELDLKEPQVTWFARRGSPTPTFDVVVRAGLLQHLRLALGRARRRLSRSDTGSPSKPPGRPAAWSMNVVPRDVVERAVTEHGGEVVAVRPSGSAGPHYRTFRYYVRKQ